MVGENAVGKKGDRFRGEETRGCGFSLKTRSAVLVPLKIDYTVTQTRNKS